MEVLDVKRLVPRLLLLSPSTIKPECPFDPKLQCTVRYEGPEYAPIEIPRTRFLLVRRPGKFWLSHPERCRLAVLISALRGLTEFHLDYDE